MIIGDMLGVPEEDQEQLGRWADMFMHYDPDAETGDRSRGSCSSTRSEPKASPR